MDYLLNGLPYFPGTTIFGTGLFADGTAAAPSISFAADTDTGFYRKGSGQVQFSSNGNASLVFDNGILWSSALNAYLQLTSAGAVSLSGALNITAGGRTLLGTTTDSGALLQIGTNTTTSAGGMVFGTDTFLYRSAAGCLTVDQNAAFSKLRLAESGVLKVQLESANGDCFLSTETAGKTITFRTGVEITALTLDASQNATFAGSVTAASAANFTFSGRSYISSPADGIIRLLNNAGTDFSRLQFGGTTVGFPSLKRSGANLVVRSADDAQDAAILAYCHVSTNVAITAAAGAVSYGGTTATTVGAAGGASLLPATPLGYIIVNVAGTAAKIPYYNA
jgi:hypothetical protein